MNHIQLIFGDEPQLIEEEKHRFISQYKALPVSIFDDEAEPDKINEQLSQDSLFGEQKLLILVNLPVIRKSGSKNSDSWDSLYHALIDYKGDNPVLLIYHDTIDKRIKSNTAFLKAVPHAECKKLNHSEMLNWIASYCSSNGYKLMPDGREYISRLLELWQDVPVSFMRTEFDRYFLLLKEDTEITEAFLMEHSSDYGAKNIFTFKEALLNKRADILLELFPFMFSYKEVDRAMSYIEGQLRLQLLVSECRQAGMTVRDIESLCKRHNSSYKPYPIKLAYEAAGKTSVTALRALLKGLYEVILDSRNNKGDIWRFRDLCLTYCGYKGTK